MRIQTKQAKQISNEYNKKYHQKNKERINAKHRAYEAAIKDREKKEMRDYDKVAYKMTEEEKKQFNRRWELVFIPTQQTEYLYKVKGMYDGYSNK